MWGCEQAWKGFTLYVPCDQPCITLFPLFTRMAFCSGPACVVQRVQDHPQVEDPIRDTERPAMKLQDMSEHNNVYNHIQCYNVNVQLPQLYKHNQLMYIEASPQEGDVTLSLSPLIRNKDGQIIVCLPWVNCSR